MLVLVHVRRHMNEKAGVRKNYAGPESLRNTGRTRSGGGTDARAGDRGREGNGRRCSVSHRPPRDRHFIRSLAVESAFCHSPPPTIHPRAAVCRVAEVARTIVSRFRVISFCENGRRMAQAARRSSCRLLTVMWTCMLSRCASLVPRAACHAPSSWRRRSRR